MGCTIVDSINQYISTLCSSVAGSISCPPWKKYPGNEYENNDLQSISGGHFSGRKWPKISTASWELTRMRKKVSLMLWKWDMKSKANLCHTAVPLTGAVIDGHFRACVLYGQQRRGEVELGYCGITSSGLHLACSGVPAVAVFLVLCKSVCGWKNKNYGL